MTMPSLDPLLTVPYVGLTEFKASPTWMDLDNLIEGGIQAQQDGELYNQLLKASAWADNFVMMPLRAHYQVEDLICRVDARGRIFIHPSHAPIKSVAAVSFGCDLSLMQTVSLTDAVWVQDRRGIIVALSGINGQWASSLQFGPAPSYSTEVYVQVEYVAGYAHGVIQTATAANAQSITLDSALGFNGPSTSFAGTSYGASVARIWDPLNPTANTGGEEAATVQSVNNNTITLASTLANAHAVGANVSELPAEIKQAITQYACGLMLREAVENDMPYPGSPGPSSRQSEAGGVAGGLIGEAEKCLAKYRRVR